MSDVISTIKKPNIAEWVSILRVLEIAELTESDLPMGYACHLNVGYNASHFTVFLSVFTLVFLIPLELLELLLLYKVASKIN